jgi:Tol biopolymer transport system component/DNA-binding winged helix-turn-helix (wHTH) protein
MAESRGTAAPGGGTRYAFDAFIVDAAERLVLRQGRVVPLTAKTFDTLLVFVQNPGRLLGKDELMDRVWNGSFVEEGNLAKNISLLRKALGDTGRQHRYIATVSGRGYRFIAGVVRPGDGPEEVLRPQEAPSPAHPPSARRTAYLAGAAAFAIAAAGLGLVLEGRAGRRPPPPSPFEQVRLTTSGRASRAAISPDGGAVLYTENGELKVRPLADGSARVLRPAGPDLGYVSLAVSPDGKSAYYSARREPSTFSLYRMPLSGGEPQKVLDGIYGGITFSPDGKRFAFLRRYPELNQYSLLIADADGSNVRSLAASSRPDNFDGTPSWSPDGTTIVCPRLQTDGGYHVAIASIGVRDGSVAKIPTRRWSWMNSLVWMPDSRGLWMVAQDHEAVNAQIWRVDRSSGDVRQMSADSYIYESLSGTRDATTLVAIKRRLESHVWIVESGQAAQITTGFDKYDGVGGLHWMPDGRLFYHSRGSGRNAIWRMRADGGDAQLVTNDGGGGFDVSPDGRMLVFQSAEAGRLGLAALDLDTLEKRRLTHSGTDMTPDVDPRGRWIVYSHFSEKHAVYRVPLTGDQPTSLFDQYRTVSSPAVSPDGSRIAFAFGRTQTDSVQYGIGVISAEDGRLLATYPVRLSFGTPYERPTIQWSPDGRFLHHLKLEGGISNVWRIDLSDGSASPVTRFTSGRIFNYAFSDDGRRLALARGGVESDVLVMRAVE